MEDQEIVELYFRRDEQAIVQTDRKYGPFCYSVAYNVLSDQEDARECVSDSFVSIEKLFVNEDGYWVRRDPGFDPNAERADYQVITREKAQEIITSYPEKTINWKPFAQYPLR